METIHSVLAPAGAAARHLTNALRRLQDDFLAQAKKSSKGVKSELGSARADFNEAISRLGDATDQLRDVIGTSKDAYAESMLDKYHAGIDYARALKERANALTLPRLDLPRADRYINRGHATRNTVLIAGATAGVGYAIYRLAKRLRAMPKQAAPKRKIAQAAKTASAAAKSAKTRAKKTAARVTDAVIDGARETATRAH